ncbi:MAG: hypothetical protein GYA55_09650 [SAR324 cluster bacterium]|uniref:Endonuclease/exonuclease/phosphatase domain-containing protein n=1 Tax=SAR324 cluster bacterium TaxID=2024889 RepID=A0A7X9IK78_9DELT|nr:hypothetical protein [SAR324 cluster bacterium]
MKIRNFTLLFLLFLIFFDSTKAISELRYFGRFSEVRENVITICSQNLERYGSKRIFLNANPQKNDYDFERKEEAIVERIKKAQCDVIALQEILGKNQREAEDSVNNLAAVISRAVGQSYEGLVGETNDDFIRVGFIYSRSRLEVEEAASYKDDELPKLLPIQRPHLFLRLPLELKAKLRLRNGSALPISLVTFHFKSKSGGTKDPTGYMWETIRMESAEKLRELVLKRNEKAFKTGGPILVLLGDRNSDETQASSEILEGNLRLSSFQGINPECQLSKKAKPLCRDAITDHQQVFYSVLTRDPDTGALPGTHTYRKQTSWLDDILMPQASLPYALEDATKEGDYDSGVVLDPPEASDHALVFVRLTI